jgi:hypothetical protein
MTIAQAQTLIVPPAMATAFDLEERFRMLLIEHMAVPAARILREEPQARAVVAVCGCHYDDDGYNWELSMMPVVALPARLDPEDLFELAVNCYDDFDAHYEKFKANRVLVPQNLLQLFVPIGEDDWQAIALFERGEGERELRIQRFPTGHQRSYW